MLIADELLDEVIAAGHRADPYPLYRELRERGHVHHSERDGLWYALRYETCRSLLQDNRLGHDTVGPMRRPGLAGRPPRVRRLLERRRRRGLTMLTANPPDHTRLRGPVNRAFTPRRVEGLRRADAVSDERDECGQPRSGTLRGAAPRSRLPARRRVPAGSGPATLIEDRRRRVS